jgi:hypothetical protein
MTSQTKTLLPSFQTNKKSDVSCALHGPCRPLMYGRDVYPIWLLFGLGVQTVACYTYLLQTIERDKVCDRGSGTDLLEAIVISFEDIITVFHGGTEKNHKKIQYNSRPLSQELKAKFFEYIPRMQSRMFLTCV